MSYQEANEADPTGERTIGKATGTKHHLNQAKYYAAVYRSPPEMARNPTRPLGKLQVTQGYYCVHLPDDNERAQKISRAKSESIAQLHSGRVYWKQADQTCN